MKTTQFFKMVRLVLAVLFSGIFVCVFSAPGSARSKCSGYNYYKDAGGYLIYHEMPVTFNEAKQRCAEEGGIIASPINEGIKAAMMDIMKIRHVSKKPFTGFTAKSKNGGIFSSIEGIQLSEIDHSWAPGEPNNYNGAENCICLSPYYGTMLDVNCDHRHPYFCFMKEARAKTLNVCGANVTGYALEETTGSCYKVHLWGLPYNDAAKACKEEGGHLLIINGDTETQAIKKLFSKYKPSSFIETGGHTAMIGIRFSEKSGKWMTVQGETIEEVGYENWAPGEPNNVENNQNCVGVYRSGIWDDISCETEYGYICEKRPEIVICK